MCALLIPENASSPFLNARFTIYQFYAIFLKKWQNEWMEIVKIPTSRLKSQSVIIAVLLLVVGFFATIFRNETKEREEEKIINLLKSLLILLLLKLVIEFNEKLQSELTVFGA